MKRHDHQSVGTLTGYGLIQGIRHDMRQEIEPGLYVRAATEEFGSIDAPDRTPAGSMTNLGDGYGCMSQVWRE